MADQELIVLEVSPERDPDGARLRATLEAHLEAERMHTLRIILLHCMAAFSVPLWLATTWPKLLPPGLCNLSILGWAGCAAGCVLSLASERRWRRRVLDGEASLARPRAVSS